MHPNPSSQLDSSYVKFLVYVLVALFGLGTWTNIAGLWIELPLIVPVLPESWQLPAKLALIINAANVFPLFVVFASLVLKLNTAPFEVPVNFVLLTMSIGFAICFALFWTKTAILFTGEQSVALMVLCFFTAIADCMSSTTFIPFLHRYEPIYLNAYFTGEGLTSLLPALLGVAQGIGVSECVPNLIDPLNNQTLNEIHYQPRFSVRTFFFILSSLPVSALVAFTSLRLMKTGRAKMNSKPSRQQSRIFILMESLDDLSSIKETINRINEIEDRLHENQMKQRKNFKEKFQKIFFSESTFFLLITFHASAMLYGACQGLTTYSLNAYSVNTFHYTIIISQFAYPAMTLIGAFVPEVSSKTIYFLYSITMGLFIYIFITAKMSPCPPLMYHAVGHVIIFIVWISIYLTASSLRIFLGNYFRKYLGHQGLIWFGVATQMGSLVGALITFLMTNTFELFRERNLCDQSLVC